MPGVRDLIIGLTRGVALLMACSCSLTPALGSETLSSELLRSVVRIETAPDSKGQFEIGSGFLLSTSDNGQGKLLLITNKHMLGDWNPVDRDIKAFRPWINVFFYRNGNPSYRPTRINVLSPAGSVDSKVHLHPEADIDLVAVDVTEIRRDRVEAFAITSYGPSFLLRFARIRDFQTDIGDQVFALGYPLGIRSLQDDYPLAKAGYLSSIPGREIDIPFPGLSRQGAKAVASFKGKFLVVDGLIVPGNSGGPVVLAGGVRSRMNPATNQLEFTDKPIQNLVIGVVSCGLGASGLTVVISSDYLLDWISGPEFK